MSGLGAQHTAASRNYRLERARAGKSAKRELVANHALSRESWHHGQQMAPNPNYTGFKVVVLGEGKLQKFAQVPPPLTEQAPLWRLPQHCGTSAS